jgi:hypothetical protein
MERRDGNPRKRVKVAHHAEKETKGRDASHFDSKGNASENGSVGQICIDWGELEITDQIVASEDTLQLSD